MTDLAQHHYVAFLRGINVGTGASARRIAMTDLAACVRSVGVGDVKTVLATGNVLFSADANPDDARQLLEAAIGERFGFDARVFVKSLPEVAELVSACPLDRAAVGADGSVPHTYVTFTSDAETAQQVVAALGFTGNDGGAGRASGGAPGAVVPAGGTPSAPAPWSDATALGDVLFWQTPKGSSLENPVAKLLNRAAFKERHTTRNLNTLDKILAARA